MEPILTPALHTEKNINAKHHLRTNDLYSGGRAQMVQYSIAASTTEKFKWNVKMYRIDKQDWFTIQSLSSSYFLTEPKSDLASKRGDKLYITYEIPGK